jgi:hypothetical protein
LRAEPLSIPQLPSFFGKSDSLEDLKKIKPASGRPKVMDNLLALEQ